MRTTEQEIAYGLGFYDGRSDRNKGRSPVTDFSLYNECYEDGYLAGYDE